MLQEVLVVDINTRYRGTISFNRVPDGCVLVSCGGARGLMSCLSRPLSTRHGREDLLEKRYYCGHLMPRERPFDRMV